uniref:Uncharacterized protein n=1 Tax=Mus musculus TaxID=10090 RepID=Q3UXP0_MOUSE|nr:unnamed protein product [Mus musculus]
MKFVGKIHGLYLNNLVFHFNLKIFLCISFKDKPPVVRASQSHIPSGSQMFGFC